MTGYTGRLACVRCGFEADTATPWAGCTACAGQGVHANILPIYGHGSVEPDVAQPGIFRYRNRLPVPATAAPVSLHEGATPLVDAGPLTAQVGVGELWFKDEARNPTWSYKDRLAAVAVTNARAGGADTVAVATTGNHGAAAAAYAAVAGIRCVILTVEWVPTTMKVLMQSYGADVLALPTPPQRWTLLRQAVEQWGWVPLSGYLDPPVGSNPFGVDGYKTIAFEIMDQVGEVPDAVVVPAAYGDGLAGIQRGFADLVALGAAERQPKLVAADPLGAHVAALAAWPGNPPSVQWRQTSSFSIGSPVATHQAVAAVRASGGTAVSVPDDDVVMAAQQTIASTCGLFLEASSAICLPAVEQLVRNGHLDADSRVVCIATSTGLKDIGAAERRLPPVPVIEPDLGALERALAARR